VALKYEGDGNRELYGGTARERAHVDQWLEVEGQSFHAAASALVYQLGSRPRKGEKPDEAVVTSNLQKLEAVLDVYEAELAARPFLAGHFFSLADLSHLPRTAALVSLPAADSSLPDHQLLGHRLLGGRPNVNAWWARISSRPSWLRVQLEAQASHP
jgi:glutathione S-transferase